MDEHEQPPKWRGYGSMVTFELVSEHGDAHEVYDVATMEVPEEVEQQVNERGGWR
jgi:hypothetical protein